MGNEEKIEKLFKQFEGEISPQKEEYTINVMTKVHSYKTGEGFGELSLTNSKPRAASILATQDSQFACLSKKDFENIIGEEVKKDFEK